MNDNWSRMDMGRGESPSSDPYRHPAGRSCSLVLGVPVVVAALALKVLKVKRGKR